MTHYRYIDTPIGHLLIAGTAQELVQIAFEGSSHATPADDWSPGPCAVLDQAEGELKAYFAGERHQFSVPHCPQGTPFQTQVWHALCTIPYGKTCSYATIAKHIGNPNAVRAVGAANGRNPLPIIVPCHRVIGSNGTLTGFAGGLAIKAHLLSLEQAR